jgi:hypothetical protein
MGLEPTTSRTTIWRSNRLSYNRHAGGIIPALASGVNNFGVTSQKILCRQSKKYNGVSESAQRISTK